MFLLDSKQKKAIMVQADTDGHWPFLRGAVMDHMKLYQEKLRSPKEAVQLIKDGDWVDYSQACSYPQAFDRALSRRSGELRDVKLRCAISMIPIATVENDPGGSFTYNV